VNQDTSKGERAPNSPLDQREALSVHGSDNRYCLRFIHIVPFHKCPDLLLVDYRLDQLRIEDKIGEATGWESEEGGVLPMECAQAK